MQVVSSRVGVVGVCLDASTQRALTQLLMSVPGASMVGNVPRYAGSERDAGRALEQSDMRICVMDFDGGLEDALWACERLRIDFPEVHIFACSSSSSPGQIIAAMRAGCAEYLVKPLQSEGLVESISRVEVKERQRSRSKKRGKIVTLLGAKGGTGVTSIAIHLGLQLANRGENKALLVDLHSTLGDCSLYLGTGRHQYSFYELASQADRLDRELLDGFLLKHESGLDLLDSPETLESLHYAPSASIEHTLGFLSDVYRFVVIDCAPGLTESTMAALAQSDQVGIVLTPELPSVRNAVRYLEYLGKISYRMDNVKLVLNRHQKRMALTEAQIEKALGRFMSYRIPNSYGEVIRAINSGVPMLSGTRSDFNQAVRSWADDLMDEGQAQPNAAAAAASKGGLFGFLGK